MPSWNSKYALGLYIETPFISRQPALNPTEWNLFLKHVQQLCEEVYTCISIDELYQVSCEETLFPALKHVCPLDHL